MGREKKVVGPAAARLAQVDYGYDVRSQDTKTTRAYVALAEEFKSACDRREGKLDMTEAESREIHAKAEAVLKKIQVFRKTYCQLLPEPLTGAVDRAEQEWEQVVYILGRRAYP